MNSIVGPSFKVDFMKKIFVGPVNSTQDPLKTLDVQNSKRWTLSKRILRLSLYFQLKKLKLSFFLYYFNELSVLF